MARAGHLMRRGWGTLHVDGAAEMVLAGFVAALRSARVDAGLSQDALASGLAVGGRAVSEWENQVSEPKLGHLIGWSGELGLRLVIVGRDGEVYKGPSRPRPGDSWEVFERRRLAWPLKTRRIVLGMSQTELGRRVGVSKVSIQRWELAQVPPRPMTLIVWAHKLGVSVALGPDWSGVADARTGRTGSGARGA